MDVSLSTIQTYLIGFITFVLAYNYLRKESWRRLPPGPIALPLIGSLPFLGSDLRISLMKMAAKYGDIFTVYLGMKRVVVLSGFDIITEALMKHGKSFVDRPNLIGIETFGNGIGFAATNGLVWKEQRRHCLRTLKELGDNALEDTILEEVDLCIQEMRKCTGKPFFPKSLLQKSMSNVIVNVLCGKRYSYTETNFSKYLETVGEVGKVINSSGVLMIFPFLRYLPGDIGGLKRLDSGLKEINKAHQVWIDEQKTDFNADNPATNFIQSYLQKIEKEADNPRSVFNENQLLGVLRDLFLNGSETVVSTLSWAIIFMVRYPDVQSHIHADIDDVIGEYVTPRMYHQRELPYVEACLHEVQRLADLVPFPGPHCMSEDIEIRGYHLPKGTMIMCSFYSLHMDPTVWSNATEFNPDRFIENKKVKLKKELMPFGAGKRKCAGEKLARMELFLYFTSLMKYFKFSQSPGYPMPDMNGDLEFLHVPKPYHITMDYRY